MDDIGRDYPVMSRHIAELCIQTYVVHNQWTHFSNTSVPTQAPRGCG